MSRIKMAHWGLWLAASMAAAIGPGQHARAGEGAARPAVGSQPAGIEPADMVPLGRPRMMMAAEELPKRIAWARPGGPLNDYLEQLRKRVLTGGGYSTWFRTHAALLYLLTGEEAFAQKAYTPKDVWGGTMEQDPLIYDWLVAADGYWKKTAFPDAERRPYEERLAAGLGQANFADDRNPIPAASRHTYDSANWREIVEFNHTSLARNTIQIHDTDMPRGPWGAMKMLFEGSQNHYCQRGYAQGGRIDALETSADYTYVNADATPMYKAIYVDQGNPRRDRAREVRRQLVYIRSRPADEGRKLAAGEFLLWQARITADSLAILLNGKTHAEYPFDKFPTLATMEKEMHATLRAPGNPKPWTVALIRGYEWWADNWREPSPPGGSLGEPHRQGFLFDDPAKAGWPISGGALDGGMFGMGGIYAKAYPLYQRPDYSQRAWKQVCGLWRMETMPGGRDNQPQVHFLHILSPVDQGVAPPQASCEQNDERVTATIRTAKGRTIVLTFHKLGRPAGGHIRIDQPETLDRDFHEAVPSADGADAGTQPVGSRSQ